ncbi:MAG: choice-of-anchor U domain-containing protein [bacterium]
MTKITRRAFIFFLLLNVVIFGLSHLPANKVKAVVQSFDVTNTNDSGAGSLRQAIEDANTNGNPSDMDLITFTIPGSGVHTISPATALPAITEKVTINGYSQPGASANTTISPNPMDSFIKIEIDGHNIAVGVTGIDLQADSSVIRGIAIFGFARPIQDTNAYNIKVNGTNDIVAGNYIGTRADGLTKGLGQNDNGVVASDTATGLAIGGTNPADRNIVAQVSTTNTAAGIFLVNQATVYGNYIGIGRDGITDFTPEAADANLIPGTSSSWSVGINATGTNSQIGGTASGMRNVISGNTINIVLSGGLNFVQGNYIGTDYTGTVRNTITNGIGVTSSIGDASLIGGTGAGEGNLISGLSGASVVIANFNANAADLHVGTTRASVLGNTIEKVGIFNFLSFGTSNLGIDLAEVTDTSDPSDYLPDEVQLLGPNSIPIDANTPGPDKDVGDNDSGPNGYINSPVLKSASQAGNQLTIVYDLDAKDATLPANQYRLEFYANDESTIFGSGPGQTFLGAIDNATPGTNITATLTINNDQTYKALSATTTAKDTSVDRGGNNNGYGGTSEFAQNIRIGTPVDLEADGVLTAVENAAPNNGDGNGDGLADSQEPNVTSYLLANVGSGTTDAPIYSTFQNQGCSSNSSVTSVSADSLPVKDQGYSYPYGLTNFTLNCSRDQSATITKYYFTDQSATNFKLRKYKPSTLTFVDIPGASINSVMIGTKKALKATYTIVDGGPLDDDGVANGIIIDPVGLATANTLASILPTVGTLYALIPVGLAAFVTLIYIYLDYRKHKKPLVDEDPETNYNFWHHIKVVTIPVLKYKISLVVDKQEPVGSSVH